MKTAYHTSREWTKSAYSKLKGHPTDEVGQDDFGVKSAQEAYQVQASMFRSVSVLPSLPLCIFTPRHLKLLLTAPFCVRSCYPTGPCLCYPQEPHFPPGAPDSGCDTEGCQGSQGLGLEDWQEEEQVLISGPSSSAQSLFPSIGIFRYALYTTHSIPRSLLSPSSVFEHIADHSRALGLFPPPPPL